MTDEQITTDTAGAAGAPDAESRRAKVRRLLIDPLAAGGFRFPKAMPEADQRKALDALADRVGYMSDDGLAALRECMASKGQGSARDFWPALASFTAFAEAFEPRPLDEMPALLRWFASAAGQEAAARGEAYLVAEYQFWLAKKHPPVSPAHRRLVAQSAADMARKAELARDRSRRGVPPQFDEDQWLRWFEATHDRVSGYLREVAA